MSPKIPQLKKQLRPILKKYHVNQSYIFGSVARSEAKPKSDLDLLVSLPGNASLLTLISLQQELEELLGRKVDITTPRAISPRLYRSIKPDMVRVL